MQEDSEFLSKSEHVFRVFFVNERCRYINKALKPRLHWPTNIQITTNQLFIGRDRKQTINVKNIKTKQNAVFNIDGVYRKLQLRKECILFTSSSLV